MHCPDPDPVGVEFLATELPEHVRAFFDEQRNTAQSKRRTRWFTPSS
ncbi:MAG: hypothetical protein CBHOC_5288 [uncultured Caballeronia sp.]|nr:MAG: hypothetical protein CBHOC_5288 [uncultured Caballeronia sp.]